MTNPKSRKSSKSTAHLRNDDGHNDGNELMVEDAVVDTVAGEGINRVYPYLPSEEDSITEEACSPTSTPSTDEEDDDDEEEGELSLDTCSSFSLQECIDEFKARRMRRISTQSRDVPDHHHKEKDMQKVASVQADEDLINQNRSNKEHERKCKPCKNGFCYCFTSDSGDAMGGGRANSGGVARAPHVRQTHRRSRKSEGSQVTPAAVQSGMTKIKENRRQSAPSRLKVQQQDKQITDPPTKQATANITNATARDQLTAISSLETTSKDAPLIHIIQELRNNCVISEVRVNKHKMQAQRSRSLSSKPSPKKTQFNLEPVQSPAKILPKAAFSPQKNPLPTAPPLDKISELDSLSEPFIYCTSLDTSAKSNDSGRHRHKAAGRLLQKRLSHTHINFKPRNLDIPPPKPPRCSLGSADEKASTVSTLASTSPSVREAERVVDEFLRSKGVSVPGEKTDRERQRMKDEKERENKRAKERQQQMKKLTANAGRKRENRKSYPLTQTGHKTRIQKSLPTCPSLSDIEHIVDTKGKHSNYDKNIHRQHSDKSIKEHSFSWREDDPKIRDMLNYDANANRKEFRSQSVQAGPQTIGWRIPPKIDLDTVDGGERHNLAANISTKNTPVKTRVQQQANDSQKFIFHEQLKNFIQSPWSNKHANNSKNSSIHKKPKSSLKNSSRKFLNSSKKKILKLVSPKKDNKEQRDIPFAARKTPLRSIGIQTSKEELRYESSTTPQSPPGSYFSAVQTSHLSSTPPTNEPPEAHFNFNRTVHSPPKKTTKATATRKLNFPLHIGGDGGETNTRESATLTKTYRSFHSDLDEDVTLSKMGYILNNIRAKLEASDEHALRTFMEIERREKQLAGFDCTDGLRRLRHQTRVDVHPNRNFAIVETTQDPIYSEIEEDSIHISSSPQFDNKTGVEHFSTEHDPAVLYAKVIKKPPRKSIIASQSIIQDWNPNTTLAKCMRDSLHSNIMLKPLPPPPPPPPTTPINATSLISATKAVPETLSQSLNNVRVMEQHSLPKRNRNLSKSDLSLQRSDIFLENLCRSEIMIDRDGALECLEKVDNRDLDASYISINSEQTSTSPPEDDVDGALYSDKDVSYEIPNDAATDYFNTAGSQHGLSCIEQPHTTFQSTPKKANKPTTFMTKQFLDEGIDQGLSINISAESFSSPHHQHLLNHSNSCPTTPCKLPTIPCDKEQHDDKSCTQSLIEVSSSTSNMVVNKSSPFCKATHARYQRLKDALRKSLRKSKHFVKNETKRLSTSLSFPTSTPSPAAVNHNQSDQNWDRNGSSFDLDNLFALETEESVDQQLVKAVSICRQLPDLEISAEMVEAERLLLFSTLKREMRRMADVISTRRPGGDARKMKRFFIDAMRLPIKSDASQDLFFNYFYICTFECEGVIKSTQSVECRNCEAIFRDCGIEFYCSDQDKKEAEVRCEIFMLRLRKVSTISLEPKKAVLKLPNMLSSGSSLSSSRDEIVSRFRLHGAFTLSTNDFIPYEYVEAESKTCERICLRSSTTCSLTIIPRKKSTNISTELLLTGRAEVRLPKCNYSSFLNVQDPHNQHNWNRRWCTLDGFFLRVWQDANDMSELPLLLFDMRCYKGNSSLECAAREICARPRSFSLDCCTTILKFENNDANNSAMVVFFSAESQNDLNNWLLKLNEVLTFISNWMK